MGYNKNCGLSEQEFELEKIVDLIKNECSTLKCIAILKNLQASTDISKLLLTDIRICDEQYNNIIKTIEEYGKRKISHNTGPI